MIVNWNYTALSESYLKRPNYSEIAFDTFISITQTSVGIKCCDIGAGAAHLTKMLADYGLEVTAIEPNDKMRENGIKKTNTFQMYNG